MTMNKDICSKENHPPDGEPVCSKYVQETSTVNSLKVPAVPAPRHPLPIKVNHTESKELPSSSNDPKVEKKKPWAISDFDILQALVSGKFGSIYLAREKESQYVVALKVLYRSQIKGSAMNRQVCRELEIQCRMRHPNILRMYGCFHDEKCIYIILEYAKNGALSNLLLERGRFDEKTAAIYVRDLTKALIYCHDKKVIHRGIKPDNLLLGDNLQLKVADFGCSVRARSSQRITFCGSWDYISPEMVDGKPQSYQVDIWSLGVLSYELLVGKPPFEPQDTWHTFRKTKHIIIKYPYYISEKAVNLMRMLLVIDPERRLTLQNVLQHPWIIENAPECVLTLGVNHDHQAIINE